MKKAILLLVVVLMGTMVFAAPKAAIAPTSSSSGMKIGVGVDNGLTCLRFAGDTMNSAVGMMFSNTSNGVGTTFALGGKVTLNLTGGAIPTFAGGALRYVSSPGSRSDITISGIYGAETVIGNTLNVGFDIYPLTFTSTSVGGASGTTISMGGGSVYGYYMF
jgi:hypothetical protein